MNWEPIDQLEIDNFETDLNNCWCDKCGNDISYPYYSLQIPHNTIDLCLMCYSKPFNLKVSNSSFSIRARCLLCGQTIDSMFPKKAHLESSQRISFYICDTCNIYDNNKFKVIFEIVYQHRLKVRRSKLILLNVHSTTRYEHKDIALQITRERISKWAALVEDICTIPRQFGSIKQWSIFTDEQPCLNIGTLFLMVDCSIETNGRVAALISDKYCRAHIYILHSTFDGYKTYKSNWMNIKHTLSDANIIAIVKQFKTFVQTKSYGKLIRKYWPILTENIFNDIYRKIHQPEITGS